MFQELHDKKKQMANIIELSNLAYESRDNFQMEIAAIEQVFICSTIGYIYMYILISITNILLFIAMFMSILNLGQSKRARGFRRANDYIG